MIILSLTSFRIFFFFLKKNKIKWKSPGYINETVKYLCVNSFLFIVIELGQCLTYFEYGRSRRSGSVIDESHLIIER
jgi:hypothetical protein